MPPDLVVDNIRLLSAIMSSRRGWASFKSLSSERCLALMDLMLPRISHHSWVVQVHCTGNAATLLLLVGGGPACHVLEGSCAVVDGSMEGC